MATITKPGEPRGLYRGIVNREEVRGLEKWDWPTKVSSQVLATDLFGEIIVDVGAGPNHDLGNIIAKERGGRYVAVDINNGLVEMQQKLGREAYRGDVTRLSKDLPPIGERARVITHTRFVVMHLAPRKRQRAIRELAAIGSRGYVLDFNWRSFIQTASSKSMRELVAISLDFANRKGIDLYHGGKLKKLIGETLGESYEVRERIFSQGVGNHYGENIDLARRQIGAFAQEGDYERVEQLQTLIKDFEKLRQENNSQDYFEIPRIHAVSFTEKTP